MRESAQAALGAPGRCSHPCPPRTNGRLYLEGVVHVQHPAVQDGRTHRGDPQRPALPQRPPPGAHRLARETGHHRSFLLAGTPSHEGLRLDHGCPRKHRARGAIVDLREDWDDLTCGGAQGGIRFPVCSLELGPLPHPAPPAWYPVCNPFGRFWRRGRRDHGCCTRIGRPSPELRPEGPAGWRKGIQTGHFVQTTDPAELPNHPQLREDSGGHDSWFFLNYQVPSVKINPQTKPIL